MKIEFYEEFPSKENLSKLEEITFPTKIFIAAKSLNEFKAWERVAKNYKKNLDVAYWPIVKNSYWVSPFSNYEDLAELFYELDLIENDILIDLELPLKKDWKLYPKNIFNLGKNKKLINNFLERNKERITTAEYIRTAYSPLAKFLGLGYEVQNERSFMMYTSMMNSNEKSFAKEKLSRMENKKNVSLSLGTLAKGVMGNEPVLPPKGLEKDLKFARDNGFRKAIIFRLEGVTPEHLKVINKFST